MTLHVALAVSALAASAMLFFSGVVRPLAAVALLASGLEVAMAFGLLRLHVAGVPLGLVLGLCLAVPGLVAWQRAATRRRDVSGRSDRSAARPLPHTGGRRPSTRSRAASAATTASRPTCRRAPRWMRSGI